MRNLDDFVHKDSNKTKQFSTIPKRSNLPFNKFTFRPLTSPVRYTIKALLTKSRMMFVHVLRIYSYIYNSDVEISTGIAVHKLVDVCETPIF